MKSRTYERFKMFAEPHLGRMKKILFGLLAFYLGSSDHSWELLRALLVIYAIVVAVVAVWLIIVELYTRYASSIFSERYVIPVPFANHQPSR